MPELCALDVLTVIRNQKGKNRGNLVRVKDWLHCSAREPLRAVVSSQAIHRLDQVINRNAIVPFGATDLWGGLSSPPRLKKKPQAGIPRSAGLRHNVRPSLWDLISVMATKQAMNRPATFAGLYETESTTFGAGEPCLGGATGTIPCVKKVPPSPLQPRLEPGNTCRPKLYCSLAFFTSSRGTMAWSAGMVSMSAATRKSS